MELSVVLVWHKIEVLLEDPIIWIQSSPEFSLSIWEISFFFILQRIMGFGEYIINFIDAGFNDLPRRQTHNVWKLVLQNLSFIDDYIVEQLFSHIFSLLLVALKIFCDGRRLDLLKVQELFQTVFHAILLLQTIFVKAMHKHRMLTDKEQRGAFNNIHAWNLIILEANDSEKVR